MSWTASWTSERRRNTGEIEKHLNIYGKTDSLFNTHWFGQNTWSALCSYSPNALALMPCRKSQYESYFFIQEIQIIWWKQLLKFPLWQLHVWKSCSAWLVSLITAGSSNWDVLMNRLHNKNATFVFRPEKFKQLWFMGYSVEAIICHLCWSPFTRIMTLKLIDTHEIVMLLCCYAGCVLDSCENFCRWSINTWKISLFAATVFNTQPA